MSAVLNAVHRRRLQRGGFRHRVAINAPVRGGELYPVAGGQRGKRSEMLGVVVGCDDQIVCQEGTKLAAGGYLQAGIVPFLHHRQLQRQLGDLNKTDVWVAVNGDDSHFRGRGFCRGCSSPRGSCSLRGSVRDGFRENPQDTRGVFPCPGVLLPVVQEQEQRRQQQRRAQQKKTKTRRLLTPRHASFSAAAPRPRRAPSDRPRPEPGSASFAARFGSGRRCW